jgi:predicted nucleic acid-binding protein
MLVVSDATPIHYLVLIDEIHLLRELYGRIVIPEAVVKELSVPKTPSAVRNWIASMPEWTSVGTIRRPASLPFASLGLGERQAIALARKSRRSILLTDDLKARNAAESVNIQVVPTIRVLSAASALSLLDLEDALRRLQQTNFRVAREIIDQILHPPSAEPSK